MNKQSGYIHISTASFFVFLGVIGVIGWAIVEVLIWLLSHIDISWV